MANKFSEGRVFIVGGQECTIHPYYFEFDAFTDAAHIHCTSGGQGITSAIQDSVRAKLKGWHDSYPPL